VKSSVKIRVVYVCTVYCGQILSSLIEPKLDKIMFAIMDNIVPCARIITIVDFESLIIFVLTTFQATSRYTESGQLSWSLPLR